MWCNKRAHEISPFVGGFNAARSMICGATRTDYAFCPPAIVFQCRTQHDMWCNLATGRRWSTPLRRFNAARSMICGATPSFAMAAMVGFRFQCRTQHDMWCNRLSLALAWRELCCFNAARSMICGATPSLTALVPRRARGHFGKSSIFLPFFPYGAAFLPKNHGVNRRIPLCGAELRPNGKWRR